MTDIEVDQYYDVRADNFYYEEPLGDWGVTETVLDFGFKRGEMYDSGELKLTQRETDSLLAYACSIVWEAHRTKQKRPFFLSARGIRDATPGQLAPLTKHNQILCPEDLWRDLQAITFEEKALRTLANLVREEDGIGEGVHLPMGLRPYPGGYARVRIEGTTGPEGLLFAATGKEGPLLLHYLIERGLIREGEDHTAQDISIYITPQGYAVANDVGTGARDEVRRAFMVCRFIESLDMVYERCYKVVSEHPDVRCPIARVKDVHHVDRIDDKIVRMIEEATIVVVDLTEQNFNIAFEAGYALALNKPIVWTQRFDGGDFRPPFDIQSQNILLWHPDRLDEFSEALRFRMLAALDKAAVGAKR